MSLVESRWQRTLTFCGLYVAQGIPWGFMLITLPAYLAAHSQIGDGEIGRLKAIILVPWSFKLIWAPLVDSVTVRSMGRRRPWILFAEAMMAVTLLGFFGLRDLTSSLGFILAMYFVHNCFASLQDLCTDALAIDVIPFREQGRMNGLMWGSKLVGKGIAAWGLSIVLNAYGLRTCIAVQIALLLGIMLIPTFLLERPGEKRFPWSAGQAQAVDVSSVRSPWAVLKEVWRGFSLVTTGVYIAFTLLMLLASGTNEVVTNTLFIQFLDPAWTDVEYSRASGLYATGPIILGSIMGGVLSDRFGRRPILIAGMVGYGLAAITFALSRGMWNERWFSMGYLLSCETLAAVTSVGFLSMAMRISWTTAAATVFTTYMTLSNLSHVVGNWLAGPVREALKFGSESPAANMRSYELTFAAVAVASVVPLLLLIWVSPDEVDRHKAAEPDGQNAISSASN